MLTLLTDTHLDKPVDVWISAPSPNFVAMATRVGPEVQWIADFPQAELFDSLIIVQASLVFAVYVYYNQCTKLHVCKKGV